jgi:rRNA maturation endonuclease Nob1
MTSQLESPALPDVHLFCPECGGPATLKTVMPSMFTPDVDDITYVCDSCGAETKVQTKAR